MDLLKLTALELGEKIKVKEVTVREAVDAVIGQIKEAESEIHSFVTIDEEGAYGQAEEIQKKMEYMTFLPYFGSFRTLKSHFMKNNQSIELCEGAGE